MDRAVMFLIAGICVYYLLPPNERCLLGKYSSLLLPTFFKIFQPSFNGKFQPLRKKCERHRDKSKPREIHNVVNIFGFSEKFVIPLMRLSGAQ
jgi:hypothetical protein